MTRTDCTATGIRGKNAFIESLLRDGVGVSEMSESLSAESEVRSRLAVNFVASVIPEKEAALEKGCSQAGNRFVLDLLARLGEVSDVSVAITSYRPAIMFPRSKLILHFPNKRFELGTYEQAQVAFVNILVLKQITMALSIFLDLLMWGFSHRSQRRVMVAYNVFSPISIPTLIAAWITGSTPVALIADTPHGHYAYKGVKGLLERLDYLLQTRIMRRFAGMICLTRQTWVDFASERPGLVVEGGVDSNEAAEPASRTSFAMPQEQLHTRASMYSGQLNALNGIPMLLEAFSQVQDPDVQLWLLGRGECESMVMDAAARDSRISFLGFLPNKEVRALQRNATLLINPRPSRQEIAKYTFPSKLMEYMQSGTPVLTTRLPGIPADYYQHLLSIESETAEGMAAALRTSLSLPADVLKDLGESAREFVTRDKSWQVQAGRIARFLRVVAEGTHLTPEISRV